LLAEFGAGTTISGTYWGGTLVNVTDPLETGSQNYSAAGDGAWWLEGGHGFFQTGPMINNTYTYDNSYLGGDPWHGTNGSNYLLADGHVKFLNGAFVTAGIANVTTMRATSNCPESSPSISNPSGTACSLYSATFSPI